MSNYNEISNQVAVIRMTDKTLAFYANLSPAPKNSFMELIDGKIKMGINDFSKGKGDDAVWASYNFELKDVKYLYERAKLSHMPNPFRAQKIHGAFPITEGKDKGLCKAFHLQICYNAVRSDGVVSRLPWNISISNGVAVAAHGKIENTFYEKANTYQERYIASTNVSAVDFLDCMEKIMAYISMYRDIVGRKLIPEGLDELEKIKERSTFQDKKAEQPAATASSAASAPGPQKAEPPATPVSQSTEAPKTASAVEKPDLHPTTMIIQSDFQALDGGQCIAQCVVKGNRKQFNIYFDKMQDELIEAQSKQTPITVNLYQDKQKRFHCYGLTA